ncbi:anti-sigma factor [Phycicoccus sonneratiae]|uniref:Anti-sigma factor n=1 Tax=Phycicoccus sonneratiae TaxID=2807628 RepID=A0ABS2CT29_9MICO|nr:anti-sigma factor [Phycicoccus sonneraticus]MBM6402264.1 anti-sigma factor [Phycicoccus sonneraticus]
MTPAEDVHPDDDLVLVASGAAVRPEVATHVATCARCTSEVAALRPVVELVRGPAPALETPSPAVWDAVLAELDGAPVPARGSAPDAASPVEDAEPAVVRPLRPAAGGRRVSPWWLGVAAAVGLVVGGAGVAVVGRPAPEPSPSVLARASLDTLDTRQVLGNASAVRLDGHLDLDVDTPRLEAGSGYLEVWLINRDLRRMVSVGVLRPGEGTQRFAIDQTLLDQGYVIVDISREGFDDRPEHSGDSLARGTLAL